MNLSKALDLIAPSEGNISHLYKCTRGFMTVGVGNMLPIIDAALALPFVGDSEGRPATKSQVSTAWNLVSAMPAGLKASAYRGANHNIFLPQSEVLVLFEARVAEFTRQLTQHFPDLDSWPEPAALATLDIAFNVGVGGLLKFTHLCAALASQDWSAAAASCHRKDSSDRRNDGTRDLYMSAVSL